MAVGGCLCTFGTLSLPHTLGVKHTQKYFAALMAASDASAIIYYIFQLLYEHAGLSLKVIFLGYAVAPAIYFFVCPLLYPKNCAPVDVQVNDDNNNNNHLGVENNDNRKTYQSMMDVDYRDVVNQHKHTHTHKHKQTKDSAENANDNAVCAVSNEGWVPDPGIMGALRDPRFW